MPKEKDITAEQIYKDVNKGLGFKTKFSIEENESEAVSFYENDAWIGLEHLKIPKPNTPITQYAVTRMRVELLKNSVSYTFTPEDVDADDEELIKAGLHFTGMSKKVFKDINQKLLTEDAVLAGQLSGLGGIYYTWNGKAKGGNKNKYVGQMAGQIFSASDVILGDVKESEKEKQPWMILPVRRTVKEANQIAKDNGINIKIIPDRVSDNTNHNRHEVDEDKMVTIYMRFYKEDGKVLHTMSVKGDMISKVIDLDIDVYPIALFHWERTREHGYGRSFAQDMVVTHRLVNGLDSARIISAQLHGNPVLVLPEGIKYSGKPGTAIRVREAADSNGVKYLQPPSLTATQNLTADFRDTVLQFMGINDNLTGASSDDTTSAILLKMEASATQIDPARRNLQSFNRQIAEIYCAFFKSKYNDKRSYTEQNRGGDDVVETFVGTDYRDVSFNVNTGQSEMSSKRLKHESLRMDLSANYITYRQFLELSDEEAVPYASEMLAKMGSEEAEQIIIQDMVADYLMYKPEVKQQFTGMEEKEMTEAIINLMVADEEFMNLSVVPKEPIVPQAPQSPVSNEVVPIGINSLPQEQIQPQGDIEPLLGGNIQPDIEPLLGGNTQPDIQPLLG